MIKSSEIRFKKAVAEALWDCKHWNALVKKSLEHRVTLCNPPGYILQMGCRIQSTLVLGRLCTHEN